MGCFLKATFSYGFSHIVIARPQMSKEELRALMPALANKTYFNYGGQGPLPTPSLDAITTTWCQIQELGPFTGAVWPLIEGTTSQLRQHLGQWFGVGTQRVAFRKHPTYV